MAGPAASVLVIFPSRSPTWRELLSPYASAWLEPDFCQVADTTGHGGQYAGEPRPYVGSVGSYDRVEGIGEHSIHEIDAVERTANRTFTHSIVLAFMCNDSADHRILCEVAAALAQRHDGMVNFGSIGAPIEELEMARCVWFEEGAEFFTVLGTAEAGRRWLKHPGFHMLK